jgi:DNA-binding transcriptional LysR family regulator
MGSPFDSLSELRVGDLLTFLAVQRAESITAAARELRVTPSQVSKAIGRLEEQIHTKLLARSSRGVSLSESGRRILPHVESAVARLRQLRRADAPEELELTVAAPSYLIAIFLPVIALSTPQLRVRGLEMPPALVRAYAAENFFDMTLLPAGMERMPSTWVATQIGTLRKGLFGTPEMAARLGKPITVEKLQGIPFVGPVYNADGQFVPVDDDCPYSHTDRTLGHEAQTIGLALELAARTDQVVFGPVIAARRHLDAGTLVELKVEGWDVRDPLILASNGDRVLSKVEQAVVKALQAELALIDPAQNRAPRSGS